MYFLRVHDIYDGLVVRMTTVADPANHTDRHGGAGPLSSSTGVLGRPPPSPTSGRFWRNPSYGSAGSATVASLWSCTRKVGSPNGACCGCLPDPSGGRRGRRLGSALRRQAGEAEEIRSG